MAGETKSTRSEVDVAIVGAGVSGLTAARRLTQAGVESVLVLEAKARVGGRAVSQPLGLEDRLVDGGGEMIGPGQDAVYALLDELGLSYFETYYGGESLYQRDAERGTFSGNLPPLPPDAQADFERAEQALNALAATLPLDAPWNAPDASALDGQTLASWFDAHVTTRAARKVLDRKFLNAYGTPGSQVSLLYTLYYLAGCGQLQRSFSAASHRIVGGAHQLATRMAAELGERIRVNAPVRAIDQSAPGRVVVRGDGFEVAARRVIVALNPGECRAIAFTPHLPARRALLQRAWRGTSVIKFHAVYRAPFWRAQGYSGYAYLDYGALPSVYDASPPDGSAGILMAWLMPTLDGAGLGGPEQLYDDAEQRRATLLRLFAEWYGPQALDPLVCQEMNWLEEPYTLGCACPTTPGVLTSFGAALRPPVGRLHWGSTETATHWIGYLNGAIEAGERTAREVLAAL